MQVRCQPICQVAELWTSSHLPGALVREPALGRCRGTALQRQDNGVALARPIECRKVRERVRRGTSARHVLTSVSFGRKFKLDERPTSEACVSRALSLRLCAPDCSRTLAHALQAAVARRAGCCPGCLPGQGAGTRL